MNGRSLGALFAPNEGPADDKPDRASAVPASSIGEAAVEDGGVPFGQVRVDRA